MVIASVGVVYAITIIIVGDDFRLLVDGGGNNYRRLIISHWCLWESRVAVVDKPLSIARSLGGCDYCCMTLLFIVTVKCRWIFHRGC